MMTGWNPRFWETHILTFAIYIFQRPLATKCWKAIRKSISVAGKDTIQDFNLLKSVEVWRHNGEN